MNQHAQRAVAFPIVKVGSNSALCWMIEHREEEEPTGVLYLSAEEEGEIYHLLVVAESHQG